LSAKTGNKAPLRRGTDNEMLGWDTNVEGMAISPQVAAFRPDEVNEFFSIYLIYPTALGPGV
jgi:hypothetical protein